MSIKERLQRLKAKIQNRSILRPLDEDDREALKELGRITQEVTEDGQLSAEELILLGVAVDILREARSNT